MTARIALLALVTGLFAAAWAGDHPRSARAAGRSRPTMQTPYPDDAVKETVLHRWSQKTPAELDASQASAIAACADDEIADALQAVSAAESFDDVSVRIDWLGIAGQLHEQYAQAQRISRTRPLWHRLTFSLARILAEPQAEHSSIAAEPSDATRK